MNELRIDDLQVPVLTTEDEKAQIAMLSSLKDGDVFVKLYVLFEEHFQQFLSLFHGRSIRIPTLKALKQMDYHCKIYTFVKLRGFSDGAITQAAKTFKRERSTVVRIVNRVRATVDAFDVREYLKDG